MKRSWLVRVAALVIVSVAACEETGAGRAGSAALGMHQHAGSSDPDDLTAETSDIGPANSLVESDEAGTSCDADAGLSDDVATHSRARGARLGKVCYATCTVLNTGSGTCPDTVSGYGETTFLGGCKKACRKSRGDAQSKLPPGCVINQCHQSGC